MKNNPYLVTAEHALMLVNTSMAQAQKLLPAEIVGLSVFGEKGARYSAAAWEKVEFWYGTQPDRDQHVWDTLTDLKLLAEASACLTTVVKSREREGVVPDLRLAKVRRT